MRKTFFQAICLGVMLCVLLPSAFARKKIPVEAQPVIYQRVKFKPHFYTNAGVIEGFDVATGKKIWEQKVFDVVYKKGLEWDNQWVYITSLKANDRGELLVGTDNGKSYTVLIPKNILKS